MASGGIVLSIWVGRHVEAAAGDEASGGEQGSYHPAAL
jgi:hypothetical protein